MQTYKNLYERNRTALEDFLEYRKQKEKKEKQKLLYLKEYSDDYDDGEYLDSRKRFSK